MKQYITLVSGDRAKCIDKTVVLLKKTNVYKKQKRVNFLGRARYMDGLIIAVFVI